MQITLREINIKTKGKRFASHIIFMPMPLTQCSSHITAKNVRYIIKDFD